MEKSGEGREVYRCRFCRREFGSRIALSRHMNERARLGTCPVKSRKRRSSKYCRDLKRASRGEWNKQEDVEEFT